MVVIVFSSAIFLVDYTRHGVRCIRDISIQVPNPFVNSPEHLDENRMGAGAQLVLLGTSVSDRQMCE
jgi:hypothetical protein